MRRKKLEYILEKNLHEIKKQLRGTWRRLNQEKIQHIQNYQDLVDQLRQAYDYSEEKINLQINNFLKKVRHQPRLADFTRLRAELYKKADDPLGE